MENPLIGYSVGERQRQLYKEEFMKFALSHEQGSMTDVKERSRSKSRRARYEATRRAAELEESSSLVDQINRSRQYNNYPNRLAMKQRFAYSPGSHTRSGSLDVTRPQSVDMSLNPPRSSAIDQS